MTNEQLASFIKQGGNDELIPLLWENVRKLLYIFADRYFRAYRDNLEQYGITAWDLKQQAYSAFLKAIEGYDESKGYAFSSYLKYPFKNAVRSLLTKDTLNRSDSLNVLVKGSDDSEPTERGDLVADERSLDFVEHIEDEAETEHIKHVVRSAVDLLPDEEKRIINAYYFEGKTYKDIAAGNGKSIERIRQQHNKALKHLRNNRELLRLRDDLGYSSQRVYHNSVNSFRRFGCSNFEQVAISRVDIEKGEQYKRRELIEKYLNGSITLDEFMESCKKFDNE